ncbi:MAG TPA: hypothetical protein PKC43_06365 [Phycisphaerales bacterium]|nr:hypothetical protein [Phycisphaerales bacterium]HMP37056.1 hypothetical protein [Phycisphaerales bacterium]
MLTVTSRCTCSRCAVERDGKPAKDGSAKLPRGWKRWCDALWCDTCWRRGWSMRAVSMPIASAARDGEQIERSALRDLIRAACQMASTAANIVIRECVATDIVRLPGMAKLPPMPAFPPGPTGKASTHVYHRVRAALPDLDPQSVTSIVQAAQRKWSASRFDVVWRRSAAPPSYRDDMPCPIAAAATSVAMDGDRAVVSIRLGRSRVACTMVQGAEWRRQLATLRRIASREWPGGEASVYLRDGRPMIKVCAWVPVSAPRETDGVLSVRTCGDHMLTLTVGQTVRRVNCDRDRRMLETHDRRLQRWSDDMKPEVRPPSMVAEHLQEDREIACRARARVVDTLTHTLSSIVAGLARRRRVARVVYDNTDRTYMSGSFPWHMLAERIRQKVAANGQEMLTITPDASTRVVAPPQEMLASEAGQ